MASKLLIAQLCKVICFFIHEIWILSISDDPLNENVIFENQINLITIGSIAPKNSYVEGFFIFDLHVNCM